MGVQCLHQRHIPALWVNLQRPVWPGRFKALHGLHPVHSIHSTTIPSTLQSTGMFSFCTSFQLRCCLPHCWWCCSCPWSAQCRQCYLCSSRPCSELPACATGISVLVLDEASDGLQRLYLFKLQAAWKQPHSLQAVCPSHVRAALQLSCHLWQELLAEAC